MTRRIFAIGDIHGCNHELNQLLARIRPDPLTDTLVFIGDYLDRGPNPEGSSRPSSIWKKPFRT